ncbi:hypothetical protein L596_004650 [Steinernema carpocapsae]|uniref:EF-hand domain-containing protein n=1 Tax=Steinernema carpocapsae TaxID=34508 RepID=A0A4U8UWG2_STECR|nr:hypothetical protein L596_004650 [Steinernema carpocapsae]
MDRFNPRLNEFRRIDSNGDEKLTFTEFLLGDRPYIEAQSRNFHKHDLNGDGVVTREEFEGYYRRQDEEQREREIQADNFFKQLGGGIYTNRRDREEPVFNFPSDSVFRNFQPNSPGGSSQPVQQQNPPPQQLPKAANETVAL